jgi:hypothetical protein
MAIESGLTEGRYCASRGFSWGSIPFRQSAFLPNLFSEPKQAVSGRTYTGPDSNERSERNSDASTYRRKPHSANYAINTSANSTSSCRGSECLNNFLAGWIHIYTSSTEDNLLMLRTHDALMKAFGNRCHLYLT